MKSQPLHITILGAGESGIGAALLAQQQGATVFVSDFGTIGDRQLMELEAAGIEYEMGGHNKERILTSDLVIKSPGIPEKAPIVQRILAGEFPVRRLSDPKNKLPVRRLSKDNDESSPELIGEIEYAFRCMKQGQIIAITGSNGKTTTTMLIAHLLQSGGLDARAGGNIGTSFARLLLEPATAATIYVLELSSFQLDSLKDFKADQAVLLNITPDHLDRYDYQLKNYIDSKLRVFLNQGGSDKAYYFGDDENIINGLERISLESKVEIISERTTSGSTNFQLSPTKLKGRHNALNAAFAVAIAKDLGLKRDAIQAGLDSFEPAPHRMEVVATIDDVTYINDSKATNVDATRYALDAVETPLIWIAGGTDKGNDYDPLLPVVRGRVRALICLGIDNGKLNAAFANDIKEIIETDSADLAVQTAKKLAKAGDTVLLSPACASFDLFRNYIDRGDQFRAAVLKL